ncbi:hypothetical protein HA402_009760 [Bradysia odoriphaga]|nr:hypothetical protein HA402_009760 [Bradysia odoriphaga]
MKKVKPKYWFSAHLHCKFAAIIPHDDDDRSETKFLGLDKCLSGRQFLQILEIEVGDCDDNCTELEYDLEWLTILYTTKHLMTVEKAFSHMPKVGDSNNRWDFQPTNEAIESVRKKFGDNLLIPKTFEKTAAPYDPLNRYAILRRTQNVQFRNRQTIDLCNVLEIDDPLDLIAMSRVVASEKS